MSEEKHAPESVLLKDIENLPVYLHSRKQLWLYCRDDVFASKCEIEKYNKKHVVIRVIWEDYDLSYLERMNLDWYLRSWVLFMDEAPEKEQWDSVPWGKRLPIFFPSFFRKKKKIPEKEEKGG